jgi:hypothetical protein
MVRNNRENRKQRRRKVIPEQEEGEGRMKWICVGPQSLLQNGDKTLTGGEQKNEDCVKEPSLV